MVRLVAIASSVFCLVLAGCASNQPAPQQSAPAAAPEPVVVAVSVVEVTARSLNVRQSPRDGAVIGSLASGERVQAPNPAQDGWLYVESDSGLSGWVSEKYVQPAGTAPRSAPAEAGGAEERVPSGDGRLEAITAGMSSSQVVEILGPPTREQSYITGKSFIPYYFGPDTSRVDFKYAGLGRVVFTRNAYSGQLKVIRVEPDESETGY